MRRQLRHPDPLWHYVREPDERHLELRELFEPMQSSARQRLGRMRLLDVRHQLQQHPLRHELLRRHTGAFHGGLLVEYLHVHLQQRQPRLRRFDTALLVEHGRSSLRLELPRLRHLRRHDGSLRQQPMHVRSVHEPCLRSQHADVWQLGLQFQQRGKLEVR